MIRATWILLFWIAAAVLVAALPLTLDLASPVVVLAVRIAVIAAAAFGYMQVGRGPASLNGAVMVGASWLLLDVIAELVVTMRLGQSWFELIGSPDSPTLRTCLLLAWISAPAFFARLHNAQQASNPSSA